MEVKLPQSEKEKIQYLVKAFKLEEKSRILKFAKMLGFLVLCFPAVNNGPVRTKACEGLKFKALRENNEKYNAKLTIDKESFAELEWWGRIGLLNNNSIRSSHFDITIFSEASTTG